MCRCSRWASPRVLRSPRPTGNRRFSCWSGPFLSKQVSRPHTQFPHVGTGRLVCLSAPLYRRRPRRCLAFRRARESVRRVDAAGLADTSFLSHAKAREGSKQITISHLRQHVNLHLIAAPSIWILTGSRGAAWTRRAESAGWALLIGVWMECFIQVQAWLSILFVYRWLAINMTMWQQEHLWLGRCKPKLPIRTLLWWFTICGTIIIAFRSSSRKIKRLYMLQFCMPVLNQTKWWKEFYNSVYSTKICTVSTLMIREMSAHGL